MRVGLLVWQIASYMAVVILLSIKTKEPMEILDTTSSLVSHFPLAITVVILHLETPLIQTLHASIVLVVFVLTMTAQ